MKTQTLTLLTLFCAACGAPPIDADQSQAALFSPSAQDLFNKFKALEAAFPLPQDVSTVAVGTLDCNTGDFSGLQTTIYWEIDEITHKPRKYTLEPHTSIAGVNAQLRFNVTNRGASNLSVVVNGKTTLADSGASLVSVDIGRAKDAAWTLRCGSRSKADELSIARPNANGAGAFTVKAWPFGLLYEPPTNIARTNFAGYSHGSQVAASETIGESSERTTTTPRFTPVDKLKNTVDAIKKRVPIAGYLSTALGAAYSALGSVSSSTISSTRVSTENTVEFSTSETTSQRTSADLGPGPGDIIGYLHNARFIWVMDRGDVSVTLIDAFNERYAFVADLLEDHETLEIAPAGTLGAHHPLDRDTIGMLLSLDPFALGSWDASRFEFVKTIHPAGDINFGVSHTYKVTDRESKITEQSTVTESHAGWLSIVGIGITSNDKTKTTLTHSSSRSNSTANTVSANFQLSAQVGESYDVDVYFDKVFGTFAFRRPRPIVSGPIFTGGGGVLAPANN